MPMASWIAWLNSCTPLQAMRAPLGCGLQTSALPAASMLMALQASVGSECVTGVMTPMTPNGAYSWSAMPFSPLKASVRRNSTPGMRSAMTSASRSCAPAGRSSSLRAPRGPAARPARCRSCGCTATALRRSSRPRARTRAGPARAAATALTIDLSTPDGDRIPIEERDQREVTHLGSSRLTPEGARIRNPAFDVTPHRYITGIITERGIFRPPYSETLRDACAGVVA